MLLFARGTPLRPGGLHASLCHAILVQLCFSARCRNWFSQVTVYLHFQSRRSIFLLCIEILLVITSNQTRGYNFVREGQIVKWRGASVADTEIPNGSGHDRVRARSRSVQEASKEVENVRGKLHITVPSPLIFHFNHWLQPTFLSIIDDFCTVSCVPRYRPRAYIGMCDVGEDILPYIW